MLRERQAEGACTILGGLLQRGALLYARIDKPTDNVHRARLKVSEHLVSVRREEDELFACDPRQRSVSRGRGSTAINSHGASRTRKSVDDVHVQAMNLPPLNVLPRRQAPWRTLTEASEVKRHRSRCAAVDAPAA